MPPSPHTFLEQENEFNTLCLKESSSLTALKRYLQVKLFPHQDHYFALLAFSCFSELIVFSILLLRILQILVQIHCFWHYVHSHNFLTMELQRLLPKSGKNMMLRLHMHILLQTFKIMR